jgi:LacI family transcriptional regulator
MKRSKPNHVTLQQVAKHAGVSLTTASFALRGSPNISQPTIKRVLSSIKQLGYVYDRGAANLRSKDNSTVGFILADLANPFYTEILIGAHQELNKLKKTVILGTTFESCETQDLLISTMLEHRVAGIILFVAPGTQSESLARIKNMGIHVVLISRRLTDIQHDYIGIDNETGGILAVEHLLKKGHRRIAFIGGIPEMYPWQGRRRGYEKALHAAGIEIDESIIMEGMCDRECGNELIRRVMNLPNPPTAVFCFNDTIAIGAMLELREMGLTPGHDVAIVGFDDIPEGRAFSPKLTTVSEFPRIIGAKAVNILQTRIETPDIETQAIVLDPELIVRESCSYKIDLLPHKG